MLGISQFGSVGILFLFKATQQQDRITRIVDTQSLRGLLLYSLHPSSPLLQGSNTHPFDKDNSALARIETFINKQSQYPPHQVIPPKKFCAIQNTL